MPVSAAMKEARLNPALPVLSSLEAPLPLIGELDGVADQVDNDLSQPGWVTPKNLGFRSDVVGELEAFLVRRKASALKLSPRQPSD